MTAQSADRRLTAHVAVALLLFAGLALRLALAPLTQGADFNAVAALSALSLHGRDVYAISQLVMTPWAYPPLLLHLYAGLIWLSIHTGWSFRLLGKLPVIAADLAVAWLIFVALRRGLGARAAAIGMSLYLFNPLALYNGAFYGRFDAIALAFMMLALVHYRGRLFAPAYALAISAKLFPLVTLPLLALGKDRQPSRRLALVGALTLLLALPEVVTNPGGLLSHLLADRRLLGWLSWYDIFPALHWLTSHQAGTLARYGIVLYAPLLLLLARCSLYEKAAASIALYIVLNYTVFEQYLLWPLPFLIVVAFLKSDWLAGWLAALCTVAGMLENEQTWSVHAFWHYAPVPRPWPLLNVALAASILAYVWALTVRSGALAERAQMARRIMTAGQPRRPALTAAWRRTPGPLSSRAKDGSS